jgi:hypothetical protein
MGAAHSPKGLEDSTTASAALAVIDGLRPSDEIEAMLGMQMAITHTLAMECLTRARRVDQIPQLDCNGNLAVKLLRTYTMQMEALSKLRRGGEQKVRVEHVHVYPGGQAIVGSVGSGSGDGGSAVESGKQPHGTNDPRALAYTPGTPLWSEEPRREAVSDSSVRCNKPR